VRVASDDVVLALVAEQDIAPIAALDVVAAVSAGAAGVVREGRAVVIDRRVDVECAGRDRGACGAARGGRFAARADQVLEVPTVESDRAAATVRQGAGGLDVD